MSATFFIQRLQTFFFIFSTFFTFFSGFYFHLNVYYIYDCSVSRSTVNNQGNDRGFCCDSWVVACNEFVNPPTLFMGGRYENVRTSLLSLSHSRSGGRVTAPIRSRKSQRRRGSVLKCPTGQISLLACSCAGQWRTRCSAVSSAPLQYGQVAESRRPIRWR